MKKITILDQVISTSLLVVIYFSNYKGISDSPLILKLLEATIILNILILLYQVLNKKGILIAFAFGMLSTSCNKTQLEDLEKFKLHQKLQHELDSINHARKTDTQCMISKEALQQRELEK